MNAINFPQEASDQPVPPPPPGSNVEDMDTSTSMVSFCRFDFNNEASPDIVKTMLKNQFDACTFTEKERGDRHLLVAFDQHIGW